MLQVKSEIIPDIWSFKIIVTSAVKYEIKPIAIMMKVSVTAEWVKNRKYLNIKLVIIPKNIPIVTETSANDRN